MRAPVFLHSGFRSRGTALWMAIRKLPGVRGYCEPFHEVLGNPWAEILRAHPDDPLLRHPNDGRPYFEEFGVVATERGVVGHDRRFAVDCYWTAPHVADLAMRAYVERLVVAATTRGEVPVCKFARSGGRVDWLAAEFGGQHVALVRPEEEQWASFRSQLDHGNPYFLAMMLLVLAAPGSPSPAVRPLLGLPADLGADSTTSTTTVLDQYPAAVALVAASCDDDRRAWFHEFHHHTVVVPSRRCTDVIDLGRLVSEDAYRAGVERRLGEMVGARVDLSSMARRGAA